jgi:bifunctional DNA-binding transcriptional regulator/antitoxin component of YhaV-PrlF toxin-antitoxin module
MPTIKPLRGNDLLCKLHDIHHLGFIDKVRACGYVTVTKAGKERLNVAAFNRECARAMGAPIDPPRSDGRRKLPYRTRVMPNGQVTIGSRYVEMLNLKPGDDLQLQVKRGRIEVSRAPKERPEEVPFTGEAQPFPVLQSMAVA